MPTESGKPAARRQILVRILKIKNWVRKWEAGTTASMNFTHAGHKLATAPSYHATVYKPPRKETKRSTEREFNTSFIYYLLDEVIWYTMCRFLYIILTDCCFGHRRPLLLKHTSHTPPTHSHTHGDSLLVHICCSVLFRSGQVRSVQWWWLCRCYSCSLCCC